MFSRNRHDMEHEMLQPCRPESETCRSSSWRSHTFHLIRLECSHEHSGNTEDLYCLVTSPILVRFERVTVIVINGIATAQPRNLPASKRPPVGFWSASEILPYSKLSKMAARSNLSEGQSRQGHTLKAVILITNNNDALSVRVSEEESRKATDLFIRLDGATSNHYRYCDIGRPSAELPIGEK